MSELNIGQLITAPQQRDAIHVAVAPVVAGESLSPGQHVGVMPSGRVAHLGCVPIGIVDPFLTGSIFEGDQFWLFLYPKTTTNLRHDWTHPAFRPDTEQFIRCSC